MAENDLIPIDLRSFINKDGRYERAETLLRGLGKSCCCHNLGG